MRLPLIDGHRVLRHMGEESGLSRIAVVVMTGAPNDVPPDLVTLPKPFDDTRLLPTVQALIGPPHRRAATPTAMDVKLLEDAMTRNAKS